MYSSIIIFADVDMEEGLYARYTFEDYTYTTSYYDTQNNAERLIEFGNPTIEYSNVIGIGKYIYFDGNDYLRDATSNGLIADGAFSLNVPQLTICTVVKANFETAQLAYFTVSEYGRDGFACEWIRANNLTKLILRNSLGSITGINSDRELNSTGWNLITYTYKVDDYIRIWHNETLVANYTGSIVLPQIESRFDIGRQQWMGYYAHGKVGFLEIYTQSVNQDWVTEKYNSVFGIDVNITSAWVDTSDLLFEELLFGTGFWFGLLLVIAILQVVSYMVPTFSSLGGIFSLLLFVAYIMNMDLNGWHTFGIILMAINGVYLILSTSE